jgi:hypothetical protein
VRFSQQKHHLYAPSSCPSGQRRIEHTTGQSKRSHRLRQGPGLSCSWQQGACEMTCCNLTSSYYANIPTQQSHFSYANTATHPSRLFFCEHGNSAISPILMRTRQRSHLTYSYVNTANANTATQPPYIFIHLRTPQRSHIGICWRSRESPNSSEQWCRTVPNSSTAARKLPRALSKLFGTVRSFPQPSESLNSKLYRSFPQRPAEQQAARECYFLGLQLYFGLGFDTSDVGHKLLFEGSNPSSIFH